MLAISWIGCVSYFSHQLERFFLFPIFDHFMPKGECYRETQLDWFFLLFGKFWPSVGLEVLDILAISWIDSFAWHVFIVDGQVPVGDISEPSNDTTVHLLRAPV